MIPETNAMWDTYDETQMGYIRLETAVQFLHYLAGLHVRELPKDSTRGTRSIKRLTLALEAELIAYVADIAPDLLPSSERRYRGSALGERVVLIADGTNKR